MDLIIGIHGILAGVTRRDAMLEFSFHARRKRPGAHVLRREYRAGPFPWLNKIWTNPRAAKGIAASAIRAMRALKEVERVYLLTHSNGACVGTLVMQRLAGAGIRTEACVMIASALQSDIRENGLSRLVDSGKLGKAVVWHSAGDRVIKPLESLPGPYGSHGARGHFLDGEPVGAFLDSGDTETEAGPFVSRDFTPYGHSEYFDGDIEERTFDLVFHDLGIMNLN